MSFRKFFQRVNVNVFIALFVFAAGWQGTALAKAPESGFSALPKAQQAMLDDVEKRTFQYFVDSTNTKNGLMPDHWPQVPGNDYFSSIASVGFGLTAYGIGVERGWMKRDEAVKRTLTTLRFFHDAPQSDAPDASGYRGFFYHFLDMETGKRFNSAPYIELSTIDTTLLLGGVLFAQSYYDRNNKDEKEIRRLADEIYRRVDWQWAAARPPLVAMGWTPENQFIRVDWAGYNEAMLLYVLALASPTHPLGASAWGAWTATYPKYWGTFQGQEHLSFHATLTHQYSHTWIDFRGIQDDAMREAGMDYFENSRRATYAQRAYAIANPMGWTGYSRDIWGLTACDGPGGYDLPFKGRTANFRAYSARGPLGQPDEYDDGTIAPTAALGSLPFAPEIVIPAANALRKWPGLYSQYGFLDSFNPSFTWTDKKLANGRINGKHGWIDTDYIGIDQGPILLQAANYRSDFVWRVMRGSKVIRRGLEAAGFAGGWLAG